MPFHNYFRDARYFQIAFQLLFLCYGVFSLHWQADWWLYGTYILSCLCAQAIGEWFFGNSATPLWIRLQNGILSAFISALGLSLLLKTNQVSIAVLAAVIAIISKFILRYRGKHLFNPSALGIVITGFFMQRSWVSPGQWGSGVVILGFVLCLGFIVTTRVQKLDISLAFLLTYIGLLFIRQRLFLGWPMDYFIQSISTGSLLLFTFFMISDPRTIPDHRLARILWAMAIAAVSFYLTAFHFMNAAPILVLVAAQPLVPLLDRLFRAPSFAWKPATALQDSEKEYLEKIYRYSTI